MMTINNVPITPALLHLPKALVTDPLMVVLGVDRVDVAPQILTIGSLLQVNTRLDHLDNVPVWPIQLPCSVSRFLWRLLRSWSMW